MSAYRLRTRLLEVRQLTHARFAKLASKQGSTAQFLPRIFERADTSQSIVYNRSRHSYLRDRDGADDGSSKLLEIALLKS